MAILDILQFRLKGVLASIGAKTTEGGEMEITEKGNLHILDELYSLSKVLDTLDRDSSHLDILITVGRWGKKVKDKSIDNDVPTL